MIEKKASTFTLQSLFTVPNFCTSCSLALGASAFFLGTQSSYLLLSLCLFFAAGLFDFLDGLTARILNQKSDFGEYFDFMVDTVVYLALLPAYLIIVFKLALWAPLLFIFSGCIRHAKQLAFRVMKREGVPSTFAAYVIPLVYWLVIVLKWNEEEINMALEVSLCLLAIGMQCTFKTAWYDHYKDKLLANKV